jgi:hypothetical protein
MKPKTTSRSKLKKRKSSASKGETRFGGGLREFSNPFAGMPQDDLIRMLVETGESWADRFENSLEKLSAAVRSVNVLHLLSILSFYGLTDGMTDEGERLNTARDDSIMQPHIELIQALALQLRIEQQSLKLSGADKIQEIWDLLIENGTAFFAQRLTQIKDAKTLEEKAILQIQERLRSHTHFVRNWGYYQRVIRISRNLYAPLNALYERLIGFSASSVITTFEQLVAQTEKGLTSHLERFVEVLAATTVEHCALTYCKIFPDMKGTPDDLIRVVQKRRISLGQLKQLILIHADLQLTNIFTFSCSDLASKLDVCNEELQQVLNALSYRFGDLIEKNPRDFFLSNPVWMKPIIRLEDDRYFCSMPQLFFGFVFRILDGLLSDDEKARAAFQKRRSEFLEDAVEALFKKAFSGSEPTRNFKWRDGEDQYETDLLLQIDSYLILVEAKSGSISRPALRGAPHRAKRHIQDLIVDPAIQSARLATKLRRMASGEKIEADFPQPLPFDLESIRMIVRLSVTLEDFATIQSNVVVLKETGWVDNELIAAPTMTLADLEIVFDILTDATQKLHYLVRRAELEERVTYFGDEIDLLGLYLETGFNLGEAEFERHPLDIGTKSEVIDDYYVARDQGITPEKPRLKSTKWWRHIRQEIERKKPEHWSEAAVMLLNVSYKDQQKIEKRFKSIMDRIKKNRHDPHRDNVLILQSRYWLHDAFAVIAYRESLNDCRHKLTGEVVDKIFADEHKTRCLVIGVNVDRGPCPFSFLTVAERNLNSDKERTQ